VEHSERIAGEVELAVIEKHAAGRRGVCEGRVGRPRIQRTLQEEETKRIIQQHYFIQYVPLCVMWSPDVSGKELERPDG